MSNLVSSVSITRFCVGLLICLGATLVGCFGSEDHSPQISTLYIPDDAEIDRHSADPETALDMYDLLVDKSPREAATDYRAQMASRGWSELHSREDDEDSLGYTFEQNEHIVLAAFIALPDGRTSIGILSRKKDPYGRNSANGN
ncbi:MAG: hypothetical protein KDA83_04455 [Planctomycetales bacterium]|nr:hypothetical protein [Planctomycetales bacterium]